MADPEKEKRLDELLDSWLSNYSAVEPRPGFETRMQAMLREQLAREQRHGWWPVWIMAGVAAAATAVVIVIVLLLPARQVHVGPIPDQSAERLPGPTLSPGNTGSGQEQAHAVKPRFKTRRSLQADDRPALFPTPAPLSEQERLLVRYMVATPPEELIAQSRPDEPDQPTDDGSPEDHTQIPQASSNARQGENL